MVNHHAPQAKDERILYNDCITVIAGYTKEKFTIHGAVAFSHSKYFRQLCLESEQSSSAEGGMEFGRINGDNKTIRLPHVNPRLFNSYVQWLYTGNVIVLDSNEISEDIGGNTQYYQLTQLWFIAEELKDTGLRNTVIDAMMELHRESGQPITLSSIKLAYRKGCTGATLRNYIVDCHVAYLTMESLREMQKKIPFDFAFDLLCAKIKARDAGNVDHMRSFQHRCTYHEHYEDAPICI